MAAPSVVGTPTTGFTASAASSVDIPYPSGINAGELLVLIVDAGNGAGWATPSGWTSIDSGSHDGTDDVEVFVKIASGSESGNLTVSQDSGTDNLAGIMFRVDTGADDTIDVATGVTSGWDPPSVSITGSEDVLVVAYVGTNGNDMDTDGQPSGYSPNNLTIKTGNTTGNAGVAAAYKQVTGSSSENPGVFTWGNSGSHHYVNTIAIHVAASGDATATPTIYAASAAMPGPTLEVAKALTAYAATVTFDGVTTTTSATMILTAYAVSVATDTPTTTTSATMILTAYGAQVAFDTPATSTGATIVLTSYPAAVSMDTPGTTASADVVLTPFAAAVAVDTPVLSAGATTTLTTYAATTSVAAAAAAWSPGQIIVDQS